MPSMQKERISRKVFDSLPEYSISLPSLTTIGKVWKCDRNFYRQNGPDPDWMICEFVDHPDPKLVGIEYRIPEIYDEPSGERK